MIYRIKKYVVSGNPITIGNKKRQFHEGMIENGSLWELLLEKQHGEEPLFDSPIKVKANFFFSNILQKSRAKKKDLHATYPSIEELSRFLLEMMKNRVIKDPRLICSMTANKLYAPQAYTEIFIEEAVDNV